MNALPYEADALAELLREAMIMIDDLTNGYPVRELHRTPASLLADVSLMFSAAGREPLDVSSVWIL